MMAACIGVSDPWVLTSAQGAARLAPLRLMSLDEQRAVPSAVILTLTDLGYAGGSFTDVLEGSSNSPLANRSEVVLLLPWSLLPVIARLEAHARATPYEHDPHFAPEDWLAAWHHFVDTDEQPPSQAVRAMAREARALQLARSATRRHHVFGTIRPLERTRLNPVRAGRDASIPERGPDDLLPDPVLTGQSAVGPSVLIAPGMSTGTDG